MPSHLFRKKLRPAVKALRRLCRPRFDLRKLGTLLVVFIPLHAIAQQTTQFWPEIDAYFKLDPMLRVSFTASSTQEAGTRIGSDFGADLDVFVKPLFDLKRFTIFQLDESKSRLLTVRAGYHYLAAPDGPNETRIVLEATPRFPLKAGILLADRNRADLRSVDGIFSWRYRNRLAMERTVAIHSYHITPYLRAEAYYDSKAQKWSRTAEDVGCIFPIRRRAEIDSYYEHMNDTSKSPNRQNHGVGLTLDLYF